MILTMEETIILEVPDSDMDEIEEQRPPDLYNYDPFDDYYDLECENP
jgi:hypothetical protein